MGAGKSTYAQEIVIYARNHGIAITHIDFDAVAQEIYSSLSEPLYANVRNAIRKEFNLSESPGGWIDRKSLRTALLIDPSDNTSFIDKEKLARLNELLADAMLFRYCDKIA